jgi:hypothetical protein
MAGGSNVTQMDRAEACTASAVTSTTAITPPPVFSHDIHFGLNLLQAHRFVGHGMQLSPMPCA